jgi:hypothetical protein
MVTIHWYKDRAENYNTGETLLDENEMRLDAGSLRRLVETAGKCVAPRALSRAPVGLVVCHWALPIACSLAAE